MELWVVHSRETGRWPFHEINFLIQTPGFLYIQNYSRNSHILTKKVTCTEDFPCLGRVARQEEILSALQWREKRRGWSSPWEQNKRYRQQSRESEMTGEIFHMGVKENDTKQWILSCIQIPPFLLLLPASRAHQHCADTTDTEGQKSQKQRSWWYI